MIAGTTSGASSVPVPPQVSDEHLLERTRCGELGLYGVLMSRHRRHLHSIARRILRNDAEAEEAVQEAHFHVLKRLDQFGGRSSFLGYLTSVVANEALSRVRSRPRLPVLDAACLPDMTEDRLFVSKAPDPEAQAIDAELRAVLQLAVERLPEIYRMVFRLREIDEMSVADAASRLGITDACVKTRLHRAKALLRTNVGARIGWRHPPAGTEPAGRHGPGGRKRG